MKKARMTCAALAACALLSAAGTAQAKEAAATDMLVYISPDEYKHSNRLSHYNLREYWYEQGPMVEPYVSQCSAPNWVASGYARPGKPPIPWYGSSRT